MDFELVHVNVGRMAAPADDPRMSGFMDNLGPMFALAEAAPGFVWRQTDDDPGFEWDAGDSAGALVNISVWASIEELEKFTYSGEHREFVRRRREWFQHMTAAAYALWWVPAGHRPTTAEAEERVRHLRANGPTPYAFTFKQNFPPGTEIPGTEIPGAAIPEPGSSEHSVPASPLL